VIGDAMTGDGIPSKTMALPLRACEVTPCKLSILLALGKRAHQSKDPSIALVQHIGGTGATVVSHILKRET
jgi:hypothetical protein